MTRDELIQLVQRIQEVDTDSEAAHDELIDVLRRNVPDPYVTDLIYYADPPLTPAEIVDRALGYRPIEMPPSS